MPFSFAFSPLSESLEQSARTHTMKTCKTQWFCWIVLSGSALFIQKLPLDILLIANDIAPLIKVFFTDFKESQKKDSLHNNLNLLCSNLIFVSNRICAFLHLKTFLCVQDVEHGILKSLKAINFISKNPMVNNKILMVNNNPTAVSCTSFNRPFYKECVPLSCYRSTFLLFMHKFYYFYANKP